MNVNISEAYKVMYDAAAAVWLQVKEGIDYCKGAGMLDKQQAKVGHCPSPRPLAESMLSAAWQMMHLHTAKYFGSSMLVQGCFTDATPCYIRILALFVLQQTDFKPCMVTIIKKA